MLIGFLDMADWLEGKGYHTLAPVVRYSPYGLIELAVGAILKRTEIGRKLLEL